MGVKFRHTLYSQEKNRKQSKNLLFLIWEEEEKSKLDSIDLSHNPLNELQKEFDPTPFLEMKERGVSEDNIRQMIRDNGFKEEMYDMFVDPKSSTPPGITKRFSAFNVQFTKYAKNWYMKLEFL